MNIEDLRLFTAVAKMKSFVKASKQTGVARSTLSRVVQRLETEVGVPLLHRTTRTVGLTSAGTMLIEKTSSAIEELEYVIRELREQRGEPVGLLRITTSPDLAINILAPVLSKLLQKYSALRFETILTLRTVDLIEEKVDLALRVYSGAPTDNALTGRKLKNMTFGWYATPEYIERNGLPTTEDDLAQHETVSVDRFFKGSRIRVDDPSFCLAMTKNSVGLGLLSENMCAEYVEKGLLLRVLPEWSVIEGQVWLLYPTGIVSPALSVLRDAIVEYITVQKE